MRLAVIGQSLLKPEFFTILSFYCGACAYMQHSSNEVVVFFF